MPEIIHHVDVRELRKGLNMSQPQFAKRFRLNLGTLRQWEQGRRHPDDAARALLRLISRVPKVVEDVFEAVHVAMR